MEKNIKTQEFLEENLHRWYHNITGDQWTKKEIKEVYLDEKSHTAQEEAIAPFPSLEDYIEDHFTIVPLFLLDGIYYSAEELREKMEEKEDLEFARFLTKTGLVQEIY